MFWKSPAKPCFNARDGRSASLVIVRSARARRLSLRIDQRGENVRLTLPPRASERQALSWVESKRRWIEEQLSQAAPATAIVPDMEIPLGSARLRLDWSPLHPRKIVRSGDRLVAGGPLDGLAPRVLRWLKAEARRLLTEETQTVAARAGVSLAGVAVGDPQSRWGSCSAAGMIRYSWRLILAPDDVRRAVVAHEVAHRVHMNHSAAFHALVRDLLGADPKAANAWLRTHGPALHRFG